jgi:preprotein translocase subunit SecA
MLKTFFREPTQQMLTKYDSLLREIQGLEKDFKHFTDDQLREKTQELKKRLEQGESEDKIKSQAFALVREASVRVLGLRHYDVQLIGGQVLNEGKIAEMKTGEGKTLVALLPTFLKALYGKGAHVVTVNDYLARRDAESVGKVHTFLGLTVGLIQEDMTPEERKLNYSCDVTYATNNELGFDYLRDNMALNAEEIVQRPFFYCVVDEVDSILIDEARTPLIISGPTQSPTQKYIQTAKLAKIIKRNIHYEVDEKNQNVTLLEEGVSFCEQALEIIDLYSPEEPWASYIINSIKAKELFTLNKSYIVSEENEIIIVDEFTGRTMFGRRWSDGLHQAVEAKENVPIQEESQTLASITYQNLFLLYETLSGMTGTAKTEELELEKIYQLKVVQIPTHRPIRRRDFPDLIYKNQYIKWQAIANECAEMYSVGRPVLVGTTTIEKSELLAALLSEYKIPYRLLNARPENVEKESEIVAQAGCKNAVTIATNMAGRGTDIVLGGNPEMLSQKDEGKEKEVIKNLGGLHVIGTERHESRRIDNQLRGRSGRQGDPGSSRFFLSLEDKLLRLFGGEQVVTLMQNVGFQDDTPIQSPLINQSLESAQKKVEAYYFDSRKQLFEYDEALNMQRNGVYSERKRVLQRGNLRDWVIEYAERSLCDLAIFVNEKSNNKEIALLSIKLQELLGIPFSILLDKEKFNLKNKIVFLQQQFHISYNLKEIEMEAIEPNLLRELERSFLLQHIDYSWKEHLQKISSLKESVRWRAYGQKNPLTEYKKEAFKLFVSMLTRIRHRVTYFILRSKILLELEA